jgi:hypothetical protein
LRHAAIELDRALTSAVNELSAEGDHDLTIRVAELAKLREGAAEQAKIALQAEMATTPEPSPEPDGEVIGHALGRLEAALRARAAQQGTAT